jgi:hypothetical protein
MSKAEVESCIRDEGNPGDTAPRSAFKRGRFDPNRRQVEVTFGGVPRISGV